MGCQVERVSFTDRVLEPCQTSTCPFSGSRLESDGSSIYALQVLCHHLSCWFLLVDLAFSSLTPYPSHSPATYGSSPVCLNLGTQALYLGQAPSHIPLDQAYKCQSEELHIHKLRKPTSAKEGTSSITNNLSISKKELQQLTNIKILVASNLSKNGSNYDR